MDLKDFGKSITVLRESRNLNKYELSIQLNISESHLGNIEHGKLPTIKTAVEIVNFFGVGLDECFFEGFDKKASEFYIHLIHSQLKLVDSNDFDFLLNVLMHIKKSKRIIAYGN